MLTKAQIDMYGPRWGACCRANDWRMARGRLVAGARGPETSEEHAAVWSWARQRAQQFHRAVTVDDLRRGATARVAGRFCSTWELNNRTFDHLLAVITLLSDTANLAATVTTQHPEQGEERRLTWFIERRAMPALDAAYVQRIMADEFGTRELAHLNLQQKRWLAMTCRERMAAKRRKRGGITAALVPAAGGAPDEDPDWTV